MTSDAPQNERSPREWHELWRVELDAARKDVGEWHEDGTEINDRYIADCENAPDSQNLFTVNVQTQLALLKGRVPKASVERRYADAADDVARVAGVLLERLLNADIEKEGDTYDAALKYALQDRLLPGLGIGRVRYVAEFEKVEARAAVMSPTGAVLAEAIPEGTKKTYECVHTDYVYWGDFLWSPCRIWEQDCRWVAFGSDMTKEQLEERFGPEIAKSITLSSPTPKEKKEEGKPDLWERARVWEIWDKTSRKVFWFSEGAGACLDIKDDPLRLERFFPCPKPLVGTTTTTKFMPVPDYELAEALYERVDRLAGRIAALEGAIDVKGVFDESNKEIQRLLGDLKGKDRLVPVKNWPMLSEKGGLAGSIDWFPLEQTVAALQILGQQLQQAKNDLYEATGLSDIMRGQGEGPGVTLGEQQLKARFSSVRLQGTQEQFAAFASEMQALKAEVIARHYDVASILKYANAEFMVDKDLAPQAAQLLKEQFALYRVQVKSEAMSMQDFAELRSEGSEVLQAITGLFQAAAPMVQALPGSMKYVLRMGQWFMSRLRGASEAEGIFDDAIQEAEQMAQQPQQGQQQDMSKVMAEEAKSQGAIAKVQAEGQVRMQEIAAEVAGDRQREEDQMRFNVQEHAQKTAITNLMRPPDQPKPVSGPGGAPR